MDKETYRYETNVLCIKMVEYMIEHKGYTANKIIDNLDEF